MAVHVIKQSGRAEPFDISKLADSLARSGAPADIAREIADKVAGKVTPAMRTRAIFRLAKRLLKQYNRASGMRYSLKKALFSLGPAGYAFEHFVGRLLAEYGYEVEMNRVMEGYCVKHEVDILAKKDNEHCIIECKYHTNGGATTDVKVALYVHSRFLDIKKACEQSPDHNGELHYGWLVTNTRCSADALKYASCIGLRVLSWRYPDEEGLEQMITAKRLYPVSILPAASKKTLEQLVARGFVLARDIADIEDEAFMKKSGLDPESCRLLKAQAAELCRHP